MKTCSMCSCVFESFQRWGSTCRPCLRVRSREWKQANREKVNAGAAQRCRDNRLKAIEILGGECACGSTEALVLDHIDGGGLEHRRHESNSSYYARIVREGGDPRFQVLCEECHAEKTSREISESNRQNPRRVNGR